MLTRQFSRQAGAQESAFAILTVTTSICSRLRRAELSSECREVTVALRDRLAVLTHLSTSAEHLRAWRSSNATVSRRWWSGLTGVLPDAIAVLSAVPAGGCIGPVKIRSTTTVPDDNNTIIAGRRCRHHAALAIDRLGRRIDTIEIQANPTGYRQLVKWANDIGRLEQIGVEGAGSDGAGLYRFLTDAGVTVIEVGRVNRQHRLRHGKSDPDDAAARAVLAGEATATPETRQSDPHPSSSETLGDQGPHPDREPDPGGARSNPCRAPRSHTEAHALEPAEMYHQAS